MAGGACAGRLASGMPCRERACSSQRDPSGWSTGGRFRRPAGERRNATCLTRLRIKCGSVFA